MKDVLRSSYDRSAAAYDAEFQALQRVKYAALLGEGAPVIAGALRAGERLLDLGCGTGLLAEWLDAAGVPRGGVFGLDFSHEMVLRARARGVRAVEADLERIPFGDRTFSAVLAFTALAIVPGSPARALAEAARVLVPGGLFALTVLKAAFDRELEAELRAAGFAARGARKDCGQDFGRIYATLSASRPGRRPRGG